MSAGASVMKGLFFGSIEAADVVPYPTMPEADTRRVDALLAKLRRLSASSVDSASIDADARIPEAVMRGARELGLFGLLIPEPYGGGGMSMSAFARVMQELAGVDASLALTVGAHQTLGAMSIARFGTESQRAAYLPRLTSGAELAAFALTEAGAGSDAASISSHAEVRPGGYVLRGAKVWVIGGDTAGVFTVFARTSPRGDDGAKPRLTAFLVERDFGVRSGPPEPKIGVRGTPTTTLHFDEVFVPAANVLGEVGRGFKVAMETLNGGRLCLAAGCVGQSKRILALATLRCTERRAFGRPIGQFGLIKDKIACMLAETFALESAVYMTTRMVDARALDYSVESAICKVMGSEVVMRVASEAMQIAAGYGYAQGQPFERLLRDARANLVFEGTNEILRCFIALSGMSAPGAAHSGVGAAMREPIKGFGLLSEFALRTARSALGRDRFSGTHAALSRETATFETYAQALERIVQQALRTHGKNIAEMQYTQRRIADVAIDLYAVACVISRTSLVLDKRGEEGARRELDLTVMFVGMAERRLAAAVSSFEKNDDELRKSIADRAYADGGYPFDVI